MLKEALATLAEGRSLGRAESVAVFEEIVRGDATPAQIGALIMALRLKGETPEEIAGAAEVMRRAAVRVRTPAGRPVLDTCGTGGDGAHTFNVSTAAALVAAGAGALVAKHGNRSVSSKSGSADVLAAAGVDIEAPLEVVERCLAELGIGFLFAPQLHPALGRVSGPRRELGVRSIFNVLGPLANPAGATCQLLGVYAAKLVPVLAETLGALGIVRGLVVHGEDGLDELSPSVPTRAAWVEGGRVRELRIEPRDAGLEPLPPGAIGGGDGPRNAELLRRLLEGEAGPLRDVVVLNTAAALWVAGLAGDLREGAERARRAIDDGSARAKLEGLVRLTRREGT